MTKTKVEIVDGLTALQKVKQNPEYWMRPLSWEEESYLVQFEDGWFCARNTWSDGKHAVEDILNLLLTEQWILEPIQADTPEVVK
jgi:hypothetical protein